MKKQELLERYVEICSNVLSENDKIRSILKSYGIAERFIFDNFNLGYSNGNVVELIKGNKELKEGFSTLGLLENNKDIFKNYITLPIYDEDKQIVNIIGYTLSARKKEKTIALNNTGIFNSLFLKKAEGVIFTHNPLETLLLIQNDYPNVTFSYGDDNKYIKFFKENRIRKTIFTFEGKARLFYDLTKNGVSAKRIEVDFKSLSNGNSKEYLEKAFKNNENSAKEFQIGQANIKVFGVGGAVPS